MTISDLERGQTVRADTDKGERKYLDVLLANERDEAILLGKYEDGYNRYFVRQRHNGSADVFLGGDKGVTEYVGIWSINC